MADVHSEETRSYNMSRIKGRDTKPELFVRKFLHARGFRYRLHEKKLPGKPDLVLPKYNTVIFINGCFWHGHQGCRYFVAPKTRTDWWLDKIQGNCQRDENNLKRLADLGWNVIRIFECELKPAQQSKTLNKLMQQLNNGDTGN